MKYLLRILLPLLLGSCFLLFQVGMKDVYSQGVTISAGSITITSHSSNIEPQTATSIPGNDSTQISTTIPNSSELQNLISYISSVMPASTSSTTTPQTSQYQKYTPASQTSFTSYNTPEHTTELISPVYFNSLPENESLLPTAESYSVTVCLSCNGTAVPGCVDKKTPSQASEKLAEIILSKYIKGTDVRPFRIVLPSSMPTDQQFQMLRQIETDAIAGIEVVLLKKGKQQNRNTFTESLRIARQEADSGINWSHSDKDNSSIHTFNIQKTAFKKLSNISISER